MSIEIPHEIETRLTEEARRQSISVDALLEALVSGHGPAARIPDIGSTPELPVWHLGGVGALHRRDMGA
jgi:hypothetical protein